MLRRVAAVEYVPLDKAAAEAGVSSATMSKHAQSGRFDANLPEGKQAVVRRGPTMKGKMWIHRSVVDAIAESYKAPA